MDTVFALSTAPGKAGVAIVRVSGPAAFKALERLCGSVPEPRVASLRQLRGQDGAALDTALVIAFPEGGGFTGEESAEFQIHGSPAVVSALLDALSRIDGLRPAVPGEFTRRALENGRLDLSQVEGLADLVEAETESQRRQALRTLSGELGAKAQEWRGSLVRAAALIEATIDFADEDIPAGAAAEVESLLQGVMSDLRAEIGGVEVAERVRTGFEVAIVGAPNVGKSTLLNALAGREAAITSARAGTTRDVIEVRMDLRGLPVTLLDTAGLRDSDDEVESIGIDRARGRADGADLRVLLAEPGQEPEMAPREGDIVLTAKGDLHPEAPDGVSGLTGQGVSELVERVAEILSLRTAVQGVATRVRHRHAMERGLAALERAMEPIRAGEAGAALAAEELRAALAALDSLVGRVDVESILDEIFASFCIGK